MYNGPAVFYHADKIEFEGRKNSYSLNAVITLFCAVIIEVTCSSRLRSKMKKEFLLICNYS